MAGTWYDFEENDRYFSEEQLKEWFPEKFEKLKKIELLQGKKEEKNLRSNIKVDKTMRKQETKSKETQTKQVDGKKTDRKNNSGEER